MQEFGYPFYLALAYFIIVGYIGRTLFVSLRLPGAVGVLCAGWLWTLFAQPEILAVRDDLQELAFFLVLLIAGFEISLQDLSLSNMIMAFLPVSVECMGIATYGMFALELTAIQAMVMATCFCALGDGLVIPKMKEFSHANPGHPVPRMVFACAPLEGCFALTMFGILSGLSHAKHEMVVSPTRVVFASILRIVLTVGLGLIVGRVSAFLIERRTKLRILRRQVFTGATVEAFLLIFGIALGMFSFGMLKADHSAFIPIGLTSGTAFQAELLVIVLGTTFAACVNHDLLQGIETTLGGVWVFGQLILFGMMGSKSSLSPFQASAGSIIPCMLVGYVFRLIGTAIGLLLTRSSRTCAMPEYGACFAANCQTFWQDLGFVFFSAVPRATIQGALAGEPLRNGFFHDEGAQGARATQLIADGGRMYIVLMSIIGMALLETFGRRLLQSSKQRARDHTELMNAEQKFFPTMFNKSRSRKRKVQQAYWKDQLNQFEVYSDAGSFNSAQADGSLIDSVATTFPEQVASNLADLEERSELSKTADEATVSADHGVDIEAGFDR